MDFITYIGAVIGFTSIDLVYRSYFEESDDIEINSLIFGMIIAPPFVYCLNALIRFY